MVKNAKWLKAHNNNCPNGNLTTSTTTEIVLRIVTTDCIYQGMLLDLRLSKSTQIIHCTLCNPCQMEDSCFMSVVMPVYSHFNEFNESLKAFDVKFSHSYNYVPYLKNR